jgi:hypothetical protein
MAQEEKQGLFFTNWLSRFAAKYDKALEYYVPLQQEFPTELDNYKGKYSQQEDYLYFKNMLKVENYAYRRKM